MSTDLVKQGPDTEVRELARLMVEKRISCIPIEDAEGNLLGLVTEDDLVHQDARIHFPTFFHFLESYIMLPGSFNRFERDFKKAVAAKASEVMNLKPVKVPPDTEIEYLATLTADHDVEYVLVVEGEKLSGIVTRTDILKAIAGGMG
jgi:CBS domain-containing protein